MFVIHFMKEHKDIMEPERLKRGFSNEILNYYVIPFAEKIGKFFYEMVEINKAHVVMLKEQGIIGAGDAAKILKALVEIERQGVQNFKFDNKLGDLYMNTESYVIGKVGEEIGGRMHTGRSRNDLFSACLRLPLSRKILNLEDYVLDLRETVLNLAAANVETILPGYTHTQHAQPITFAHYLLAIADSLARDTQRLEKAYHRVNLNPLGAAALAGTSFPLNRERTTELLGFDGVLENTLDAVSLKDDIVEIICALAIMGTTLSRLANDLVYWSTFEFGMVEIADEFCTSSSIMPQKKNPWAPEMVRAFSGELIGDAVKVFAILKNLPVGLNMDLSILERDVWNAVDVAEGMLKIMTGVLSTLIVKKKTMMHLAPEGFSTATELADAMVIKKNLPFRTAHRIVGTLVRNAIDKGLSVSDITVKMVDESALEVTGKPLGLSESDVKTALDAKVNVEVRTTRGGPAPQEVNRMIKDRKEGLNDDKASLRQERERVAAAKNKLESAVHSITGE